MSAWGVVARGRADGPMWDLPFCGPGLQVRGAPAQRGGIREVHGGIVMASSGCVHARDGNLNGGKPRHQKREKGRQSGQRLWSLPVLMVLCRWAAPWFGLKGCEGWRPRITPDRPKVARLLGERLGEFRCWILIHVSSKPGLLGVQQCALRGLSSHCTACLGRGWLSGCKGK